jgi:hypothetical protein
MPHNPLYFLTYERNPRIFSGYGIPLRNGEKSPLMGMLMVDRPNKCSENYISDLGKTFCEAMFHNGYVTLER